MSDTQEELTKLGALFAPHDEDGGNPDEFLKFERVVKKRSTKPDLHALIVLDELFPEARNVVSGSGHEIIFMLSYRDSDEIAARLTPEIVTDLVRCGVMYDDEIDCLSMFV